MRIFDHTVSLALFAAAAFAVVAWLRPAAPVDTAPPPALMQAPAALTPFTPQLPAPPVQTAPEMTLAAQIDQLIATHHPHDAMAAYRLLADCATFNRAGDRLVFDQQDLSRHDGVLPGFRSLTAREKIHDARLCAGMTERMRLARIDYLAVAAHGGVEGAALQMAAEGPFGDRSALVTRPDDPLVQEWKRDVLALLGRAAEDGDLGVLENIAFRQMGGDELFDKNPALGYRYGIAKGLIYRDLLGPDDTLHVVYAPDGELMQRIGAELTGEQRAAELAAAARIADLARLHRLQHAAGKL